MGTIEPVTPGFFVNQYINSVEITPSTTDCELTGEPEPEPEPEPELNLVVYAMISGHQDLCVINKLLY